MIFYYLLLVCMLFYGAHFKWKGINEHYIEKTSSNVIKGLFIALIFMSHIQGYIRLSGYAYNAWGDNMVLNIQSTMGQLVVVMFLFYSGYGIMESDKEKGNSYVSTMPKRRILTTLLNFDIAVLAFIVIDLFLGIPIGAKQSLLSLFAWKSVGNSNWYIFVILLCYLIAYIALRCFRNSKLTKVGGILIMTFGAYLFLLITKTSERWWYNTIFSFWAGATYSIYKDEIEQMASTHYFLMLLATIISFILICLFPRNMHGMKDNLIGIVFCLLIVMVTMKIDFNSKPMLWLGEHLFPLYIYQRLPMIVLYEFDKGDFVCQYLYLYVFLCCITTLALGYAYKYWQIKLS